MKKLLAACICAGLAFSLTGCTLGDMLYQFSVTGNLDTHESEKIETEIKTRVYMDELSGVLKDFTGSQITVSSGDDVYTFDVSDASLECAEGLITGNEISVIYEGQLADMDTSAVRALKVVDNFHKKNQLKDRKAYGKIVGFTANTITIRTKKKKTATYPIIGTEQYYQNGLKKGNWVYIHFKGKFAKSDSADSSVLDASHLKVLSVSDLDPMEIPALTPTPAPSEISEEMAEKEQQFLATVQNVDLNIIQIVPAGRKKALNLDISSIPAYFKGGISIGSRVNITYTGELKKDTLEGIQILAVTGENPDQLNDAHISFQVSGTILGTMANTVTIRTPDSALATFRTEDARNVSTQGLAEGSYVRITFHPSRSADSNIYTAVRIEDA